MSKFHYANTEDPNLLYLLQHEISDPVFYLETEGKKYVFLNDLELGAYQERGNQAIAAVSDAPFRKTAAESEGDKLTALALAILSAFNVKAVTVPENFSFALGKALELFGISVTTEKDWCSKRRQKSPEEISAVRENFAHTIEAYEFIESVLCEAEIDKDRLLYQGQPLTSEWLKREVSKLLLDHDLVSPAGLIISCGKQAAMPHHAGSGFLRPGQTVVVDIFPQSQSNHYWADMTRTYVKGTPLYEQIPKMYEAVLAAQENAMKALRPGVELKMVYEISAGIIERAGFDVGEKGYIHSLGHGLGVAIHELPNLSPKADGVLEVGDVVTVEPGLYYEEWGGVRLEDTVVITDDGYENLTNYPKDNWLIP